MKDKIIDITKKYSLEIERVNYILRQLKSGRYYESTNIPQDGYLNTHLNKLTDELNGLVKKIEYGLDSDEEKLTKEFSECVKL